MVPPTGGEKDTSPPELISVYPENLTTQFKNTQIYFSFDENISLNNWVSNFYVSPSLRAPIKTDLKGSDLILTIPDSINKEITYCISLDNCIKDVNEGNIISDLKYLFSASNFIDTLSVNGQVLDAYSLTPEDKIWVLLYNLGIDDSLIFKTSPLYMTKTNSVGIFNFTNLPNNKYEIYAIAGDNFKMDNINEKIAFYRNPVIGGETNNIILYLFNTAMDSCLQDSINHMSEIVDSVKNTDFITANLTVVLDRKTPAIISLLRGGKVIITQIAADSVIKINDVPPGEYDMKIVIDDNQNKIWDTGNLYLGVLPEKVIHYPNKILIRSNWDVELNWKINLLK